MAGRKRDGLPKLLAPLLQRLTGPGIDQIEARSRENGLREPDRRDRFLDRVQPPEFGKGPGPQRLDAERDAVDPCGTVAFEALGLDAGRVGLEGDLRVFSHGPMSRNSLKNS